VTYDFVFVTLTPMDEVDATVPVAEALARRGMRVAFFVPKEAMRRRLRASTRLDVHAVSDFAPAAPDGFPRPARDYGLPHFRYLFLPEVYVLRASERDERGVEAMAKRFFAAAESFFDREGARAVVYGRGAKLLTRVFHHVALRRGALPILHDRSPFPGRSALVSNERGRWERLDADRAPVSATEREEAREFVRAWREGGRTMLLPKGGAGEFVGRRLDVLRWVARHPLGADRAFPDNFDAPLAARRFARRMTRLLRNRAEGAFRFSRRAPAEPFVYMPLQNPVESTMTVLSKPYYRQDAMIDLVARSLPEGHVLAVKPHPEHLGAYPGGFLGRVARIPNVRLLEPSLPSAPLISRAAALAVSAGTTGFEGLVHGRPVVLLGNVFYRGHGLTHDVEDVARLDEIVGEALASRPDAERVAEFMARARRATYAGTLREPEAFAEALVAKRDEG
jgi:hypothetical protein